MPEMKLTEKRIRELQPPSNKAYERYWDTEVTGLCVKVLRSGKKKYDFKDRLNGKPIWGNNMPRCSDTALGVMRHEALEWKARIRRGENPFERVEPDTALTINELCSENLSMRLKRAKPLSASSISDMRLYSKYVADSKLGDMKVKDVTIAEAFALLLSYQNRPRMHDKLRWWMFNCFELAIKRGYVPLGANPWRYIDKQYRLPDPEDLPRFTDEEIGQLAAFLRRAEAGETEHYYDPVWLGFVWFLIRNGTRPNDTLVIERAWIDDVNGQVLIRHPKTKTGRKIIYLSSESAKSLEATVRQGNPFLFPGRGKQTHMKKYRANFLRMCEETGLNKSAYAIRRWFASTGRRVYKGEIRQVQGLVGWDSEEMALRYAGEDEELLEKRIMENAEVCQKVADRVGEILDNQLPNSYHEAPFGS